MRLFTIAGGPGSEDGSPLHILAEYVGGMDSTADDSSVTFDRRDGFSGGQEVDAGRSEGELAATEDGRRALAAWRAGDDSAYERAENDELERIQLGVQGRPRTE